MPNILDSMQTCQYNTTIVTAAGTLAKVKSADTPPVDVDVTPVQEGTAKRKVYTAVELLSGADDTFRSNVVSQVAPLVGVARSGVATNIYGALETVNTETQRCGVLTEGVVIFRKTGAGGPEVGATTDIGKPVQVAPARTGGGTPTDNHGTVVASTTTGIGKGIILSYTGNYLLVDLSR